MCTDERKECPVCHGIPEKYRNYKSEYGVVTPEQYEVLMRGHHEHEGFRTVVCFFEHELRKDKTLLLSFTGECEICNTRWDTPKVVIKGK